MLLTLMTLPEELFVPPLIVCEPLSKMPIMIDYNYVTLFVISQFLFTRTKTLLIL